MLYLRETVFAFMNILDVVDKNSGAVFASRFFRKRTARIYDTVKFLA